MNQTTRPRTPSPQPFQQRELGVAGTLGDRFRRLREEAGLEVEAAARAAAVSPKYLKAIEHGHYADLPGYVYAKNFVRSYARFLNVREETALELFDREYHVAVKIVQATEPTEPAVKPPPAILSPRGVRRLVIVVLALAVLVYLGLEIRNLTSPPDLVIMSPAKELTETNERSIRLIGKTEPETTVTANGRLLQVDHSGNFEETLDLQEGLNPIVVNAKKKRGGATTVTRNVLVTLTTQP